MNKGPKGRRIRPIYTNRLQNFVSSGQYEHANLLSMLDHARVGIPSAGSVSVWSAPGQERPLFQNAVNHDFVKTAVGASFGPSWTTHWFRIDFEVPTEWKYKVVHLEFDCECEGLVYSTDGDPLQGLTGGNVNEKRLEYIIPHSLMKGVQTIYVETGMNGLFGNGKSEQNLPPDEGMQFVLTKVDLVAPNSEARALLLDFKVIRDCATELLQQSWESHRALNVANDIMDRFRSGCQESVIACRLVAQSYIGSDVDSDRVYNGSGKSLVTAVGHCHIDTAWLWPFDESKRKIARSWSTQLDLMDRYPEHRFCGSQAQHYAWLKTDYPQLFLRVKVAIENGQFEPIGGSWVEMDTNLPSGESLVRQFLYGQRFFKHELGSICRVFWLPDTFGYAAQIPQICRLAGLDYGFTQKLSWNSINDFPHTTFNWVALDGTQLLMHMAPSNTYSARGDVAEIVQSVTEHKNLAECPQSLILFGNGDGGGGPLPAMLEKLRRCRGVSDTIGNLPRVALRESIHDFYDRVENETTHGADLPSWVGELYFETHRGTYTSQAFVKADNRKLETLLHDIEYLATIASICEEKFRYPYAELDGLWQQLLLCQFHDVIPGTAIEMVYKDVSKMYQEIFAIGEMLMRTTLIALGLDKGQEAYLSCVPWLRTELVAGRLATGSGLLTFENAKDNVSIEESNGTFTLYNGNLIVTIKEGTLTSIWDRDTSRELVETGARAGQFVMYNDDSLYSPEWNICFQAWDTEMYSLDSRRELEPRSAVQGENSLGKASVIVEYQISSSSSMQVEIMLSAHSKQIEFDCTVDWHEDMKFLKVEFPFDIRSSKASYEVQFGIVERPTHFNTSWDAARFEVCTHRFADLSEENYGVAILNDCKYGFATHGNVMRLSLLRSPKAPDANCDMGRHHMKFSILPHEGPVGIDIVHAARELNSPLRLVHGHNDNLGAISLAGSRNIILDTIKRAEPKYGETKENSKSVILRLYEAVGSKAHGTICTAFQIHAAYRTDLLETNIEQIPINESSVQISLRPFEIYTVKLELM